MRECVRVRACVCECVCVQPVVCNMDPWRCGRFAMSHGPAAAVSCLSHAAAAASFSTSLPLSLSLSENP